MLKLLCLLTVRDDESVEVARATDLELGKLSWLALSTNGLGLLDASGTSVLTTSDFEEVLDVLDLIGLVKVLIHSHPHSLTSCGILKTARGRSSEKMQRKICERWECKFKINSEGVEWV